MKAHGTAPLLRAELTKFRTVPAWVTALCAAAAAFVLLSFVSATWLLRRRDV